MIPTRIGRITPPRNGRFYCALLAGGPADKARELTEALAEKTMVKIVDHWDWERPKAFQGPIPSEVDLVLVLKDMLGHSEEGLTVEQAKKARIPFIRTQRKGSIWRQALHYYGLYGPTVTPVKQIESPDPVPAEKPSAEALPVVVAPVVELPAPITPDEVNVAQQILDEYAPVDGQIVAAAKLIAKLMRQAGLESVSVLADGQICLRSLA